MSPPNLHLESHGIDPRAISLDYECFRPIFRTSLLIFGDILLLLLHFFICLHDFLENYAREPPITQEGVIIVGPNFQTRNNLTLPLGVPCATGCSVNSRRSLLDVGRLKLR